MPFCNACSKERDSHREVILILKLAYRTNLSGLGGYFSLEIFPRDHRWNTKAFRTSHEKRGDRYARRANQTFCQEKWNDKFQSTCSRCLFVLRRCVQRTGNARNYFNLSDRGAPYNESDRRSLPTYGSFPSLAELKRDRGIIYNSQTCRSILLNDTNVLVFARTFVSSRLVTSAKSRKHRIPILEDATREKKDYYTRMNATAI